MAATADELRQLANRYKEAAKKLLEAADVLEGMESANGSINRPRRTGTRYEQLVNFLRNHGPSFRKEILARSGLPQGTLSAMLTRKNFDQDGEGRWKPKSETDE